MIAVGGNTHCKDALVRSTDGYSLSILFVVLLFLVRGLFLFFW